MSDQPFIVASETAESAVGTPRRFLPIATFVILALNLLIFLLMDYLGALEDLDTLLNFGAAYGPFFRRGEYWRLVMPIFMHGGWIHLFLNSYALYVVGPLLEYLYGYGRFALLYIATGICSSFVSMSFSNHPSVGASGAIFGILGIMLVTGYLHRESVPPRWRQAFRKGIALTIVINLMLALAIPAVQKILSRYIGSAMPRLDNWAHVGGLVSGILIAMVVPPAKYSFAPDRDEKFQPAVLVPVLVLIWALTGAASHYLKFSEITPLLQQGSRYRALHQLDQALNTFREAAKRAPLDDRPHEQMASLYLAKMQFEDAIREYTEALRLNPDLIEAQLGLSAAYRQKGDVAKAREVLEAVLKEFPPTAEGQVTLAELCAEQKLYPEAVERYQEALRLKPDFAVAHNNLAWLYATSEDTKFRNPPGALEHAERAVELTQWKEPSFIDTLAEALYASGKFSQAVKVQTKALELAPNNSELQEHMARYRKAAGV